MCFYMLTIETRVILAMKICANAVSSVEIVSLVNEFILMYIFGSML